ncbi:MAG: cytochrome c biogenesis CcdA family protein [Actinomycetia bacterium]|nr:cytochrome c biogenesis CcdA family protein [Actinomycetes bacterium]
MDLAPLTLALAAGGLSTVNPCGFAMLPAYLTFYVGADEDQLPTATSRTAQGLKTGLMVTAGFLLVFALVGLPITYGATRIVRTIPWVGMALGITLLVVGIGTFFGRKISLTIHNPIRPEQDRRPKTMFLFGIGYGIASLGCTLPVFLAVIGASLATAGPGGALLVLIAYGAGMAIMLILFSTGAALVRDGLVRSVRKIMPYMGRITGGMLTVAGVYLTYYWGRVKFGSAATLGDDPIVGFVGDFTATIERYAGTYGRPVMVVLGMVLLAIVATMMWKRLTGYGRDAQMDAVDTDPIDDAGQLEDSLKQ